MASRADRSFASRVYALCRRIPRGKVSTYGAIAKAIGKPGAARAVGNALNANPHSYETRDARKALPPASARGSRGLVPCHRVVQSDGRLGGFAHGATRKAALLKAEGVRIRNGRVDAKRVLAKL